MGRFARYSNGMCRDAPLLEWVSSTGRRRWTLHSGATPQKKETLIFAKSVSFVPQASTSLHIRQGCIPSAKLWPEGLGTRDGIVPQTRVSELLSELVLSNSGLPSACRGQL